MKAPINLASQPFRRDRAMIVASLGVSALLVISLITLIVLAMADGDQMTSVRRDIARLNGQIREATRQKSESDAVLRLPANAEVLERSVFINSLLYRKGISWTRLLSDLEKTLPPNVRVLNIRPYVNGKGQITLDLQVGAEGPEPVINLYTKMEESPLFGNLTPGNYQPPTQAEPLYRYRFTVNYAQAL